LVLHGDLNKITTEIIAYPNGLLTGVESKPCIEYAISKQQKAIDHNGTIIR